MRVASHAEKPLLHVAIGGELDRVDDSIDAAIHHDGNLVSHRGRAMAMLQAALAG